MVWLGAGLVISGRLLMGGLVITEQLPMSSLHSFIFGLCHASYLAFAIWYPTEFFFLDLTFYSPDQSVNRQPPLREVPLSRAKKKVFFKRN